MNAFEKLIVSLQFEMERPTCYGTFHLCWLLASAALVVFLSVRKERDHERTLKTILLLYAIPALMLELTKQIIWSYSYDTAAGFGHWDYQWYAAPFQLCTTPIITCLISAFLNKGKMRDSLLSFTAFVTILGSIATALYPESCFVRTVLVDIHTMYLHFGSLVISLYLLISGEIKPTFRNLLRAWLTFLAFAAIALLLDLAVYHSGLLGSGQEKETFNMFYISPYFISVLPVFDGIWTWADEHHLYLVFLLIYLFVICAGAGIVWLFAILFSKKQKPVR